jgi:hypothetical protein
MQTHRLRTLVSPAHTELLLDSCVRELGIVPGDARKVRETWRLPGALLDIAEDCTRRGDVWTAWISDGRGWLFIGNLALASARERGQPVLEIDCFDSDRRTKSHLMSTRNADGDWQTCLP